MGNVEALLIPWLTSELGVRFATDTPADLETVLPLGTFVRVGGPSDDNNPRFDMPTVAVDCYAANRGAALVFAEDVDEALRITLPGTTLNGATITRVQTITGPSWRPYDNTSLRRVGMTYRFYIKNRT